MQKHRKFIGNKRFYLMVLGVAMPIMIQNGITNFVSLLDNIMVGQVGTEQMSGVAIVNQLLFIYNLCIFGGVSGAGIFTAQYFGQGNDEGVRNTLPLQALDRRDPDGSGNHYFPWCARASDSSLPDRRSGKRGHECDISLWHFLYEGHAGRTSAVPVCAALCQHAARMRRDDASDEAPVSQPYLSI